MIFFSERKELERQYYEWIKENGIADQPINFMAFLDIHGIMNYKRAREKAGIFKLKPKTNFDRITESVESLAEYIYQVTSCCPFELIGVVAPCTIPLSNKGCTNCIKEWLQKECEG